MTANRDWESDSRPFAEALRAWIDTHDWSDAEAARQLRLPYPTLRDWLPGGRRRCRLDGAMRRLMSLIDRSGTAGRV